MELHDIILLAVSLPFAIAFVVGAYQNEKSSPGEVVEEATDRWLTEAPAALFPNQKRYYKACVEGKIAYAEYEGVLDEEVLGIPLPEGWREEIEQRIGGRPEDSDEVLKSTKDPKDFIKCPECGGKFRYANMHPTKPMCQRCWHTKHASPPILKTEYEYDIAQAQGRIASAYSVPAPLIGGNPLVLPNGRTLQPGDAMEVPVAEYRGHVLGYSELQSIKVYDIYKHAGDHLARTLVQRAASMYGEPYEQELEHKIITIDDLNPSNISRRKDAIHRKFREDRSPYDEAIIVKGTR